LSIADGNRVALMGRLRVTDFVALAFWALAVALFVLAGRVGPQSQCDYGTKDAYVVAAHGAGVALAGVALALLAAAALLLGGGIASHGRARLVRMVAAVISVLLAGYLGIFAFFNLIAFGCLE
jgi:hypothetical protein